MPREIAILSRIMTEIDSVTSAFKVLFSSIDRYLRRFPLKDWFSVCAFGLLLLTPIPLRSQSIFQRFSLKGLDFRFENSPSKQKYLIETMPGGVGLMDYNSDGLLDIFFVNGGKTGDFVQGRDNFARSNPKYWNRLYRQNSDSSFTDVTQQAGLANADNANYGMGVAIADYDNDGFSDIYISNYGQNQLYHNDGNGHFTDVTAKAGVAAGGWSVSVGFLDYDNDGNLDLFVTRYLDWNTKTSKACGGGMIAYCPPGEFPSITNILYHNSGDGTFEDVSAKAGITTQGHGLGVAFADYDGDGFTDIFVANDVVEHFLFHNNGNGMFLEKGVEAGAALTADGKMMSGMGVVFQDYDNDGRPDLIVTELPPQLYGVFHNEGDGFFTEQSLATGFGVLSGSVAGWGVGLEDFDNDGWKDTFIPQGHVLDTIEQVRPNFRYREKPLFALNRNGRFERANAGTEMPSAGRGAAFGDLNNDGWMDVITTALEASPTVFLNQGGKQHWLTVTLRGTRSNRDGFGARVQVNGQTRIATATGSYLSSNDKRLHFGLGTEPTANVEILWPSGIRQTIKGVRADQFLTVQEPEHL